MRIVITNFFKNPLEYLFGWPNMEFDTRILDRNDDRKAFQCDAMMISRDFNQAIKNLDLG